MPQPAHLDPSAFFLSGGPTGLVLIHGFTGAPPEMRQVGDYLHKGGLTVSAPLLPGHGTTVEDLNRSKWQQWAGAAETALAELLVRCSNVFVAGLSMGALVALYTAAHHSRVAGAIAYSPAVRLRSRQIELAPLLKHFMGPRQKSGESDMDDPEAAEHLWSYDQYPPAGAHELLKLQREVRRLLPQLRCPLLVVYGPRDGTIDPEAGRYTYERAGSPAKELLVLQRSGHVLTVDSEWEQVAERTYQFVTKYAAE